MGETGKFSVEDQKMGEKVSGLLGALFMSLGIYSLYSGNAIIYSANPKGKFGSASAIEGSDPVLYWVITVLEFLMGTALLVLSGYSVLKRKKAQQVAGGDAAR